jgi:ATP/maltotriose-dependent transcriptional regulator MalT
MELLERGHALEALAAAYKSAERGEGRVVLVAGEPGIGKTSLVTRFLAGLDPRTRVLFGSCDDLTIPRPLGPFRDFAGTVSPALSEALATGAAPHEIQTLLVEELELPPRPTVLVLEDLHWADEATLDSVTLVGRRIGSLPALLVITFRGGEVPPGHQLHATVGAVPADASVFLELAPLSRDAVAALAGDRAQSVYATTGGNPFYVAELLACGTDRSLPQSVANAVRGRASRLDHRSRLLLEIVSVVPKRVPVSVLDAVMSEWAAAAEEPERRGLLEIEPGFVRFRHELARHAIASSMTAAARRRVHAGILAALLEGGADPAEIVHHAEAANEEDVVADYAAVAARRAAALESHREAFSHYRRAADFANRLPAEEEAALYFELAWAAYVVSRLDVAFPAIERATVLYRTLGDETLVGQCLRVAARIHWYSGDGSTARRVAHEAVAILEPLGPSTELAAAYSTLSQLAMLGEDTSQAIAMGEIAYELATQLGDDGTRAHALVNIGTARVQLDPDATGTLLEARALADRSGNRHEAARALVNLAYTLMWWGRPLEARAHVEEAVAYAAQYEVHTLAEYARTLLAWLKLRAGEWNAAEGFAGRVVSGEKSIPQLLARIVLAELAIRRGDPDAADDLAGLAAQAERTGELQRLAPVIELQVEHALLEGAPMPCRRVEALVEEVGRARGDFTGWGAVRLAVVASVVGVEVDVAPSGSPALDAVLRRDWRGAADAYGEIGWAYDRGLMLSLLDDEEALTEALAIARELGAEPLARRAAGRLRELGAAVPRGPRASTRANPAGLTARQLEVLALLAEGRSNAEIADRLVVSPRTAEHHVAAVLAKLGATTRWDAVRRAAELELVPAARA